MSKVVITGGAGFIGSNLANYLCGHGKKVYVIDNLSNGKKEYLGKDIELKIADVASKEAVNFIKKVRPDFLVHFAALSNVQQSLENPRVDLKENFFPIINLVKVSLDIKVKKFIFSSSAAVYGKSNSVPISEDHKKQPCSPYGISKLCSEYYVSFANKKFNLPYITLRLGNVYGKNQNSGTEGGVVAIFLSNAIKDKTSTVFGNGEQTRDFIYIDDVIDAITKSLNSNIIGEFNVGTSKETSINNLANLINQTAGSKIPLNHNQSRDPGVSKNALSYLKIEKELGWKPKTNLEDGIKSTAKYFKDIS